VLLASYAWLRSDTAADEQERVKLVEAATRQGDGVATQFSIQSIGCVRHSGAMLSIANNHCDVAAIVRYNTPRLRTKTGQHRRNMDICDLRQALNGLDEA
jgi:hypothetical protein